MGMEMNGGRGSDCGEVDDCVIIGAGPAGLTAAIYLARFHLSIRLFDCGTSRAALIPRTHNHAGYPGGIRGSALLALMQQQAADFGAVREELRVESLRKDAGLFEIVAEDRTVKARTVLIATGVFNHHPPGMADDLHDAALERGLLRYCPICDGYEVTDKKVAVIGTGDHGTAEALFLRGYTRDLTLISPHGDHDLDDSCNERLNEAGIVRKSGPCGKYAIEGDRLAVETPDGMLAFDSVYPALGSHIRSELAVEAGAEATEDGCLDVDDHQRTSVEGLFAAGDVVKGLDQISHAMGAAGVAATTIRNHLADNIDLFR